MNRLPLSVVNQHPHLPVSLRSLKAKTRDILSALGLGESTLAITLIDDKSMRPLNRRFMGKAGTTDVLSFPMITGRGRKVYQNEFLGDIVISLDQANKQAAQQGISLLREVVYLIVHSVLHLIGHDHAKPVETLRMRRLEQKVWQAVMTLEK